MQQKVCKQSGPRLVGGGTGSGSSGKQTSHRVATCGNTQPAKTPETPLIDTEEFRMFAYKVLECQKKYRHDWSACPYAHQGEKAKRRDPRRFQYVAMVCLDMKTTGQCARGDACPFCHNVFELWLHPARYRTQLCNNGATCDRKVCFFAHSLDQLRTTPGQFVNEKVEQFLGNSIMANPEVMKAIFCLEQSSGGANPQIDRETTAKLASLQQQLLGSEKLFQEILNYNKVDLETTSKPYLSDQNSNRVEAQFCNPSPASPLVPPPLTPPQPQPQNQPPTCFLTNNAGIPPPPPATASDPLAQLLAITQQKSRFSTESLNSPLDLQTSPQSPQHRSANDLFAQVSQCGDNGVCGVIPEMGTLLGLCGGNNVNSSGSSDLSSCLERLRCSGSMYNNTVDAASLQQFFNALTLQPTAYNKPRTLCHQDSTNSGSSYSSNNSALDHRRNMFVGGGCNIAHSQSYNGGDFASALIPKYQNLLNYQQEQPAGLCNFGMKEGMQKFNSCPPLQQGSCGGVVTPLDDKKLLECVEYLHLFEEHPTNDNTSPAYPY